MNWLQRQSDLKRGGAKSQKWSSFASCWWVQNYMRIIMYNMRIIIRQYKDHHMTIWQLSNGNQHCWSSIASSWFHPRFTQNAIYSCHVENDPFWLNEKIYFWIWCITHQVLPNMGKAVAIADVHGLDSTITAKLWFNSSFWEIFGHKCCWLWLERCIWIWSELSFLLTMHCKKR